MATVRKLFKIFQDPPSPTPQSKSYPPGSKAKPCLQPSALPLEPISQTSIKHNVKIKTPPKGFRSPSKRYQYPSPTLAAGFGKVALPPPDSENAFTDSLQKDSTHLHPAHQSQTQPAPTSRPQLSRPAPRPASQPLPPQFMANAEFQPRPASAYAQPGLSGGQPHLQFTRPFTPTELGAGQLSPGTFSHPSGRAFSLNTQSFPEHSFSPVEGRPTSGHAAHSPSLQLYGTGFSPVESVQPNLSQSPVLQSPQDASLGRPFQPVSNAIPGDFLSHSQPYAPYAPTNTYPSNYTPSNSFDSTLPAYTHMQYVPNLQPTAPQQALFTTFPSVPNDTKTLQRPGQSENFASFPSPSRKKSLKRSASYALSPKKGRNVDTLPEPADMPEIEDDGEKPGYSYAGLIAHAILRAPERRLTLAQIYKWIIDSFEFYRHAGTGWQNSIRHNLSLNKAFQKQERPKNDSGKGNYWTIVPGMEMQFIKEKVMRKGTSIAQLAAPLQRKPTPAPLSSALAPQQWAPLPALSAAEPILREPSSDATIELS